MLESSQQSFDFQDFLLKRLKLGRAQYLTLATLGLVEINDGVQAITISLLTPILKQTLVLTDNQVSFLSSAFYIGVGLGAIISGIQSNKHGRKKALLAGAIIQFISSVFLSFTSSYSWLCFCRILYGMGFGSTLAVATVIITQLVPINLRGKILLIVGFVNTVGKLIGVGLAFVYIEGTKKYVQQYMLSLAILGLMGVILVWRYINESFRFYLFKQKHEEAFTVMNQIILKNNHLQQQLGEDQKLKIIKWAKFAFKTSDATQNSFKLLSSCKKIVLLLSLNWIFINFINFGEMLILPFILKTTQKGLSKFLWMTLGEAPALILTFNLIQREGWGRKRSLIVFYIFCGITCLALIQSLHSTILFLTKMLMKSIFQMLYPFTSESYQTPVRSIGFATNSFFGRIGATVMPFIIYPLYVNYPKSPFLLLGLVSFAGAASIFAIQKDTMHKPLDEINNLNGVELHSPDTDNSEMQGKVIEIELDKS